MTGFFRSRIVIVHVVTALAMCGLISCQPPAATNGATSAASGPIAAGLRRRRTMVRRATSARTRLPAATFCASMSDRPTSNCASAWSGNTALPAHRPTPTARPPNMPWAQRSRNRRTESSAGSAARADILTWCSTTTARAPIGRTIIESWREPVASVRARAGRAEILRAERLLRFDFLSGVPLMNPETGNQPPPTFPRCIRSCGATFMRMLPTSTERLRKPPINFAKTPKPTSAFRLRGSGSSSWN